MSERAIKNQESAHDVVRLDDDERWQKRLAEARARRAVALQEKANGDTKPSRVAKPWDVEQVTLPTIVEAPRERDENGEIRKDFADRVAAIRASRSESGEVADPPKAEVPVQERHAFVAPMPEKPALKPGVPADLDRSDFGLDDDIDALSVSQQAHAASLDALPELIAQQEIPEPQAATPVPALRGRPRGLAIGLFALALLPFLNILPPKDVGPTPTATPFFGNQPAFGLTAPNFAPPFATTSGEWRPDAVSAPTAPLPVEAPIAPALWFGMDGLPPAPKGEVLELTLPAIVAGLSGDSASLLAAVPIDTMPILPGTPSRIQVQMNAPLMQGYDSASSSAAESAFGEPAVFTKKFITLTLPIGAGTVEPVAIQPVVGSAPATLAQAAQPAIAVVDPLRVTVLVPEQGSEEEARDAAASIAELGHDIADVKIVNLTISKRNVRYFHSTDRAEAGRIADMNQASLRDFTSFRPLPAEGVVELWLSGKALERPVHVARTPRPAENSAASATVVVKEPRRGLLGWIADRLEGGDEQAVARRAASDQDGGAGRWTALESSERSAASSDDGRTTSSSGRTGVSTAAAVAETVTEVKSASATASAPTTEASEPTSEETTGSDTSERDDNDAGSSGKGRSKDKGSKKDTKDD